MKIYPYKMASESAKALANVLGVKRVKVDGIPVKDVVINWGATQINRKIEGKIINLPEKVKIACNKLDTFKVISASCRIPSYTEDRKEAEKWAKEGSLVVCRTKLNGHSGQGIVLAETVEQIVAAPLYTKYIRKKEEYRLHVNAGKVFFVQRKARKKEVPDDKVNWKIRNLDGGFVFAHQGIDVPDEAKKQAVKAIEAVGLDFGAVDIITTASGRWVVLEINTACGLEGTTLEKYREQFEQYK